MLILAKESHSVNQYRNNMCFNSFNQNTLNHHKRGKIKSDIEACLSITETMENRILLSFQQKKRRY